MNTNDMDLRFRDLTAMLAVALLPLLGSPPASAQSGVPPEVAANAHQWPLPHRDYAANRAVLDSRIFSGNVARLEVAWSVPIDISEPFGWGKAACNPVILDNIVYFQNLQSDVQAIDLSTGEIEWERKFNRGNIGPNGVAVGWGKVFGAVGLTEFVALDAQTGEQLWSFKPPRETCGEGMTIQPSLFNDTVYLGTLPGSQGCPGYPPGVGARIFALDQATGAIRWEFDTIESEDHWGNPSANGGGGIWYPPSIDIVRGLVFAGTGNPAPWPGSNGASRPGPNLYTCSVVALNAASGALEWFEQAKAHDLFDHDFQNTPVLAAVKIGGVDRDLVIGSGKTGTLIATDRATGQRLWKTPVGRHENDELTELPSGGLDIYPGALGGVLTPIAYAEGVAYAPVINWGGRFTPTSQSRLGSGTGELVAVEAATGDILWSKPFNAILTGGATVVNDLVFTATVNGLIVAFDRRTGDERWRYQAPGGINAWPAVANHTIVWPIGMGRPQLLALRLPPPPPAQWVRIPTDPASTPTGREGAAMVYDERREVILLHGGRDGTGRALSDTWEWNGQRWRLISTNGPGVTLAGCAYDVARDRTVIYGGYWAAGTLTNHMHSAQLWEWDGQSWQHIETGTAEALDGQLTVVYDRALGKVIRHGGVLNGNELINPDPTTYQWDGTNWTPLVEGTFKRGGQKAAYDSARGRTVMFGGTSTVRGSWTRDTWEFDGAGWTQVGSTGPAGRVFHAMVFDSHLGVVVLYGGFAADTNFNDTWEWDGVQWTRINVPGPTARNDVGLAYDRARHKVVLFGGTPGIHDAWLNETWEYGLPPLQLTRSERQPDGSLEFRWTGEAPPYQLQSRTDLATGDWQDEGAPTADLNATVQPDGEAKFFRVLSLFGNSR
jgi:outer membrane protein assembly factor BamB